MGRRGRKPTLACGFCDGENLHDSTRACKEMHEAQQCVRYKPPVYGPRAIGVTCPTCGQGIEGKANWPLRQEVELGLPNPEHGRDWVPCILLGETPAGYWVIAKPHWVVWTIHGPIKEDTPTLIPKAGLLLWMVTDSWRDELRHGWAEYRKSKGGNDGNAPR